MLKITPGHNQVHLGLFWRELICNAVWVKSRSFGVFTVDDDGDVKEIKTWKREMIKLGQYVSMAGQKLDEEFEKLVRKERIPKGIYTVPGSQLT